MSILIRKQINDVNLHQAVLLYSDLPRTENVIRDVRYVRRERTYYIFDGSMWQEFEFIIG